MHAKSPRKKNTPGSRHVLYAQNYDAPPESRSKIGKLRFDHVIMPACLVLKSRFFFSKMTVRCFLELAPSIYCNYILESKHTNILQAMPWIPQ